MLQGDGYGVPFNLPYKNYYERCKKAYEWVRGYVRLAATEYKTYPELLELKVILDDVVQDPGDDGENAGIPQLYRKLDGVWSYFSELRMILRLRSEWTPLSDEKKTPDEELAAIISEMEGFKKRLGEEVHTAGKAMKVKIQMILQGLDDHWDELFAPNPENLDGDTIPLPRTNNLVERGYRGIKSGVRRRTGKARVDRDIAIFGPGLELVSNLENPLYRRYVLGSPRLNIGGLCRIFAGVDPERLNSVKSERMRMR
ncbi:MAG: hypothetical protein ACE5Z5_14720, partial [Candidatus Bathyarchaeia archaeon]